MFEFLQNIFGGGQAPAAPATGGGTNSLAQLGALINPPAPTGANVTVPYRIGTTADPSAAARPFDFNQLAYILGGLGSAIAPEGSWQDRLGQFAGNLGASGVSRSWLEERFNPPKKGPSEANSINVLAPPTDSVGVSKALAQVPIKTPSVPPKGELPTETALQDVVAPTETKTSAVDAPSLAFDVSGLMQLPSLLSGADNTPFAQGFRTGLAEALGMPSAPKKKKRTSTPTPTPKASY